MSRDVPCRGSASACHKAWNCSAKGSLGWAWPWWGHVLPAEFVILAAQLPAREHLGTSPSCCDTKCSTPNTFQVERRNGTLGSVKTIMGCASSGCCSLCRNVAVNHCGLPDARQKQVWKVSAWLQKNDTQKFF